MSEYSWYVKQIWFGVEGPKPELPMLGIIKRSGQCRALGHFCHVKLSVNGRKVWASGAEDRTFYMHLVSWDDIGRQVPKDMIPALGWNDPNTYVFKHEGDVVIAGSSGTLSVLRSELIRDEWKNPNDRLTLIQKGAQCMEKNYIALMEEPMPVVSPYTARRDKPRVTLPVGSFNKEKSVFQKLEGPLSMWNGPIPRWCKQVVEVDCEGWIHVREEHVNVLWEEPCGA